MRTFSPKDSDITRQWHVIDASVVVLGLVASQAAVLLRGKHKPIFAPHVDTGGFRDHRQRRQGRPQRQQAGAEGVPALRLPGRPAVGQLRRTDGEAPRARRREGGAGMLPKNSLGRKTLRKLKVYAGPDHPHQAQQPVPFEITQVSQ